MRHMISYKYPFSFPFQCKICLEKVHFQRYYHRKHRQGVGRHPWWFPQCDVGSVYAALDGGWCAVSLALFGTEGLHNQCIREYWKSRSLRHAIADVQRRVQRQSHAVVDVSGACRWCRQPGHYASLMHLYGISTAMCSTVQSYIFHRNAPVWLNKSPNTVKIVGRNVRAQQTARLTLM